MNKLLILCFITIALSATLDLENARAQILTKHNYYRAQHQVGDLVRLPAIEKIAQNYSEYLASIGKMEHSKNKYNGERLGENLYYGYLSSNIGKNSVEKWYSEESLYDYNNPGYKQGIGHFTQLVWKNSKNLGCGVGCKSNNYCYVTCNYYPAGNYLSSFPSNVFPKVETTTSDTTEEEPESDTTKEETKPTTQDTTKEETKPTTQDTTKEETSTNTNSELEKFRNEITAQHNYYRNQHQAGNLERDTELERIAQDAAEHMVEINNFYFTSETYNGDYIGKNVFYSYNTPLGAKMVDNWYKGISKYNFDNPGYVSGAGSFTQLVWKNSEKIGCGYACKGSQCYGGCVYYPGGNYLNSFATNVLPKK